MPRIRIEEVFRALPEVADLDKPLAKAEQWGTARQLSKVCKISKPGVIKHLAQLAADGRTHIADWAPGLQAPIWVKGPGENAPRKERVPDPDRDKQRAAVKRAQQMSKHREAQAGQGRAISCATIERAIEAGPRSPFADLFDLAGDKS